MDFTKLKTLIMSSRSIVFFGGAGTSTESNIPDFRSLNGIFTRGKNEELDPETILTPKFLLEQTEEFYFFYKQFLLHPDAKPNASHFALSEIERRGQLLGVITQNIDGLHQMAGSHNVIELHGSVHNNYCLECGKTFDVQFIINSQANVPLCDDCSGVIRPDVVLYGESVNNENIELSKKMIEQAEVLIIGGTSLMVHPAASLVRHFSGRLCIIINHTPTPMDGQADFILPHDVGKVLQMIVQ
jgi:NAD-dependent deacetylase